MLYSSTRRSRLNNHLSAVGSVAATQAIISSNSISSVQSVFEEVIDRSDINYHSSVRCGLPILVWEMKSMVNAVWLSSLWLMRRIQNAYSWEFLNNTHSSISLKLLWEWLVTHEMYSKTMGETWGKSLKTWVWILLASSLWQYECPENSTETLPSPLPGSD